MEKIEPMIDLKSFIAGGMVVLIGVYWAIERQRRERPPVERRIFIVKKDMRKQEPVFSEN